jgi:shikimate kinase
VSQAKRIFIVGHSGAGKGVLAQGIAKELGWKYVDTDFAIAPSVGRPLAEILGAQGEEKFQQCLTDILSHQISKENIVVTTDDSIIDSEKNQDLLAKEFTVYLKVSTPVQLERISHNRPLLPQADYKSFLDRLHQKRDALYEKVASFTLSSDDHDLEGHIKTIVNKVGK